MFSTPVVTANAIQRVSHPERNWPVAALVLAVLGAALAIRLISISQPLVENFIDRQVHTAMIARNLTRGGSLLYPEIDIGPFPAYYMLECPLYPWLAGALSQLMGTPLDGTGRLVSAVAMAAAIGFFFDLVRRREGIRIALLGTAVFATLPVTVRYGRSFQPDSLMLASLVVAVWAMDRWSESGRGWHLAIAAFTTCVTLLLKVIAGYILIPLAYLAWRRFGWAFLRRWELWLAVVAACLPALAWYVHAWHVASTSETVSTPFWQTHKWISLERLTAGTTYRQLGYYIGLRVLTPIGLVLTVIGAMVRPVSQMGSDRNVRSGAQLFHVWLASLITYFPVLVRKLDHEHYYLALAPVAAVFAARAISAIAETPLIRRCYITGSVAATILAIGLLASDALASRTTFRNPSEWLHVTDAAAATRECTPPDSLIAAHSSILFYADRHGFTFAYGRDEIAYLFGTWNERDLEPTPAELLKFYRAQRAEYFVELLGTNRQRSNPEFFDYVRATCDIVREEPGKFLIARLHD